LLLSRRAQLAARVKLESPNFKQATDIASGQKWELRGGVLRGLSVASAATVVLQAK